MRVSHPYSDICSLFPYFITQSSHKWLEPSVSAEAEHPYAQQNKLG